MQCNESLCSDCFLFGKKHKDHEINHLENIYKNHVDIIKTESKELQNKYEHLTNFLKQIEERIDLVRQAKQERTNELEELFENLKNK